jgi:hypothetical protein
LCRSAICPIAPWPCSTRPLKEVYSTSTGAYSYTYTTSAVRDYRVILQVTGTIWESTSPIVRK